MSERAGIAKQYKRSFLLDETKLRKIVDVLRGHAKKLDRDTFVLFYVEKGEDTFYETRDIEEVLVDDNTPEKRISTVNIRLRGQRPEGQQNQKPASEETIALASFRLFADEKVNYIVDEKNRDWCLLLADELETQIKRTFTGRSLSVLKGKSLEIVSLLLLVAVFAMWASWFSPSSEPLLSIDNIRTLSVEERITKTLELVSKHNTSILPNPIAWLLIALVIVFIELRPLSRLVENSTRSVFYWGDMIPAHDRYAKRVLQIKWGVGIAFLVSLIAGLIVGWLGRAF